jgi:hypothetical protein
MPMRFSKMTWSVVAGSMTLSVLSVAAASTSKLFGGPTGLFSHGLFDAASADIQAPREVGLPPEQQLAIGRQYIGQMDQATTTVRSQLEQARAARDVVKSLCLNDKLNQIDVASRSSKDREATLDSAVTTHDKDRSRHEFMILQVLHDRVNQLVREASQCIGEEAGFIGESQVSVQIDPNIPDNNPDVLGTDVDIISEPPVTSSPTM